MRSQSPTRIKPANSWYRLVEEITTSSSSTIVIPIQFTPLQFRIDKLLHYAMHGNPPKRCLSSKAVLRVYIFLTTSARKILKMLFRNKISIFRESRPKNIVQTLPNEQFVLSKIISCPFSALLIPNFQWQNGIDFSLKLLSHSIFFVHHELSHHFQLMLLSSAILISIVHPWLLQVHELLPMHQPTLERRLQNMDELAGISALPCNITVVIASTFLILWLKLMYSRSISSPKRYRFQKSQMMII